MSAPVGDRQVGLKRDARALVFALVVASMGVGLLVPASTGHVSVAEVAWCVATLSILACAVGVHSVARTLHDPAWVWLSAALLVQPLQVGTRVLVAAFTEERIEPFGPIGGAAVATVIATVCLVAARARLVPPITPIDPVALVMVVVPLGLLAGYGSVWAGEATGHDLDAGALGIVLRISLGVVLLAQMARIDRLTRVERTAVVTGALALMIGIMLLDSGSEAFATVLLITSSGFFGLFLFSVLPRMRHLAAEQALFGPGAGTPDVAAQRQEQWRNHEVRATVAGLAAVTRVLDVYEDGLPSADRRRLTEFSRNEMERLARLVEGGRPLPVDDLGRLLTALVESLRIQGCRVALDLGADCGPARLHGVVSPVLRTLTDNAVRHAPGALVTIDARRIGDVLEVSVSDDGPGLPAELRDALFGWGARGPAAPGEGIGLSAARDLARQHGGDLRLADAPPSTRAAFVLTLPIDEVA